MKQIYLDYAAATPMSTEVLEAMRPYFTERFYNPSATYLAGRAVRQEMNDLRRKTAGILGARSAEIIFTSGATEANNLALCGVAKKFPWAKIVVSAIEHDSVLRPAQQLGARLVPVTAAGVVDTEKLAVVIDEQTVLLSVMLVNNELGTIQPLREILQLVADERQRRLKTGNNLPLYLHSDAVQAANHLDLHVSRLGVDMMTVNGGKIYGPKGAGLLYMKTGTQLEPLFSGGGQEFGWRAGTENMAAIAGLAQALETAQTRRPQEARRLMALRLEFEKKLLGLSPKVHINGNSHRTPHLVSATFAGHDNETMMMKLDEAGIRAAVGSACSAGSDEPSHVLKAIGLSDEAARSTLRLSFGRQTTRPELEIVLRQLAKLLDA